MKQGLSLIAQALTTALLVGSLLPSISAIVSKNDPRTIEVGYGCGGSCQAHYRWLMQQYEIQRPNNPVVELSNLGFTKPAFLASLFEMKTSPDVMSILPSQVRQLPLLKANAFVNLTETYQKSPYNEFPENYKRICQYRDSATNSTMHFCIPVNIYAQKLFLRPSVFAFNNVSIPTTFESMLDACDAFASRGKILFFFGIRQWFPVQYYFTTLFTRLWGSELYEKLLSGNHPWVSPEVTTTMEHWKMMIDRQCFGNTTYQQTFDFSNLSRWWGRSASISLFGMTLMPSWYNYYRFDGPEPLVNGDVPSMPFPSIRRNFPRVEILSAEAVAVSTQSLNITSAVEMAESFTNANAHRQGLINGGVTSPFIPGTGSLNNSDYQMLSTADQVVLWFDGISGGEFADVAYMYFRDFVLNQTTWTQSARALDNLATELYQSTTPRPLASVDLSRSRRSGNSTTAFFIDQAVVVLTPTTGNALIYYTIDGAEPIAGTSTLYQSPITLSAPRTFNSVTFQIKAVSLKPGLKFASATTLLEVTVQRSPAVCSKGCAFGTCVDDDQCQCSALHHNVLFSNCTEEIPQEFSSHSTVIGAVITAVNAILMSAYIFIGVVFVIYFNHKVLRAATSMSMILIVVGCLLGCSAIFFVIQKPTEFTCNARHWFASSGFGLIWGNILAKGYRIYRLFNNTSGRSIMISNTTIFLWSGAIVAIEIMLSLIYTLLNGPKPVLIRRTGFLEWTCQSQNESFDLIMIAAFVGYNALLIIGGVIIAVITRNVASDYNESQILGYTTFTFTIVTVVTIPIFAVPGLSYTIRFVLFACIIFLLTGIIMFLFCGSKVMSIAKDAGVMKRRESTSQFEPVSPTSLKGKDKAALKDGETKTETHLVTKLFCMPPGVASRWIECMIIRHPLQDLLLVANHERGTGIMTAKVSQCVVSNIQTRETSKGVTVVTAILQSAGKQSLKVQASDEETLRNLLVMPAGAANVGKSAGQSSAGQNSSVGQRESVKVGTVRTSAITE